MTSKTTLRTIVLPVIAAVLLGQAGCKRASEPKAAAAPRRRPGDLTRASWPPRSASVSPISIRPRAPATTSRDTPTPNGLPPTRSPATSPRGAPSTCWSCAHSGFSASSQSVPPARRSPPASRRSLPTSGARAWTRRASTRRGSTPLKDRLAAIDALSDGPSVADYLRKVAANGENPLFAFFPLADFKNSSMNIAYAVQGGLGLPDKTYYFDKDKKPIREAYEKHIAKVLELSGVPGDAGGGPGEDRARIRDASRPRVKVVGRHGARRLALLQPRRRRPPRTS